MGATNRSVTSLYLFYSFVYFFGHAAQLTGRPGIEPTPSAVKSQSPNHWTTREFPSHYALIH